MDKDFDNKEVLLMSNYKFILKKLFYLKERKIVRRRLTIARLIDNRLDRK